MSMRRARADTAKTQGYDSYEKTHVTSPPSHSIHPSPTHPPLSSNTKDYDKHDSKRPPTGLRADPAKHNSPSNLPDRLVDSSSPSIPPGPKAGREGRAESLSSGLHQCDRVTSITITNPSTYLLGLLVDTTVDNCFWSWQTLTVASPPLDFYKGSYVGEFGRSVPVKYREQLPKSAPVAVKEGVDSGEDTEPTVKRRKVAVEGAEAAKASVDVIAPVQEETGPTLRESTKRKRSE
ncbi:hypothetical protein BDZ89DRAFT_1129616 [Hymenopellis radicata]|nr:hypothetical protein BDZ89DRAFT_1129616 [Hymenopellis radicata]